MRPYEIAVIGGGIVGLAAARALCGGDRRSLVVVEAEAELASHQSGRNSGVIHSGLYYRPGSLKARTCVEGRDALYRYCRERGIQHERCGKVVVAVERAEIPALLELERRGRANGLEGVRRLSSAEIRELEPHAVGEAGLLVPDTGIVDFRDVARAFAADVREAGGEILTGARVSHVKREGSGLVLETARGPLRCLHLVNCAGLQSDRVARLCGLRPAVRIVPFRGEYYEVRPERRHLVRNLVYPVPDPRFPFLGVHFTRTVDGRLEAGPNAVLALKREGYERWSFSPRDAAETLLFPGFWSLARTYGGTAWTEIVRSLSPRRTVAALQRLVPAITLEDVVRAGSGVRAQAVSPRGELLDDFHLLDGERSTHVLNAPSPAATASMSIGRTIAERVLARLN